MTEAAKIAVIVLAAGGSSRMGQPKQLLPFGGVSLLRHMAAMAIASDIGDVFVVVGAEAERVAGELDGLAVVVVRNEIWGAGLASSLVAGLEAAANLGGVGAVAFVTVDQPCVDAEALVSLADGWRGGHGIVAAEYGATVGPPVLFDWRYFAEIAALTGDRGAKSVILAHMHDVLRVAMPSAGFDIDTVQDYESIVARNASL